MREGSYTTEKGQQVHYTDAKTVALVTDLYQFIDHEYHGSPSMDATRLEQIIRDLRAGKPLEAAEWDILTELQKRIGPEFEKWRNDGRDGQAAEVPQGGGRVHESGGYKTDSTTKLDRQTTPPHLFDGGMHDLAHAVKHAKRLLDPDVKGNPASMAFNHEHMMKHLESGIDHFSRMGQHLAQHSSDASIWASERADMTKLREVEAAKELGDQALTVASPETNTPTVCVDFDGVVHQGPHGLPGMVRGTLVDGAKEGLQKLKDMGFRVVILTARVDLEAVRDWVKKQGLGNLVAEVTNRKPSASAYIDDRATHFTGWKDAVTAVNPQIAVNEDLHVAGQREASWDDVSDIIEIMDARELAKLR